MDGKRECFVGKVLLDEARKKIKMIQSDRDQFTGELRQPTGVDVFCRLDNALAVVKAVTTSCSTVLLSYAQKQQSNCERFAFLLMWAEIRWCHDQLTVCLHRSSFKSIHSRRCPMASWFIETNDRGPLLVRCSDQQTKMG